MANKKLLGILLLGVVFAGIVSAQDMMDWTITIVNNTSRECTSLYVGDKNVITGKTIPSKGSLEIKMIAPDFSYTISSGYNNFSLSVSSGDSGSYTKEGIDVQPGMKIVFTDSDTFKSNKGPSYTMGGGGQGRAIPKGSSSGSGSVTTSRICIKNELRFNETIRQVYVRSAGSSSWGDNVLFATFIITGSKSSSLNISHAQNSANKFDIRVVCESGKVFTLSNVTVSNEGEVVFKD